MKFEEFQILLATASKDANEEHKAALRKGIEVLIELILLILTGSHFE
jgi:hypothetical protein